MGPGKAEGPASYIMKTQPFPIINEGHQLIALTIYLTIYLLRYARP